MKKASVPPVPPVLSAREMLSALGEHITQLRPSVSPKPKKIQISAARATASTVNSTMTVVRTSLQVMKQAGTKANLKFLTLEEVS